MIWCGVIFNGSQAIDRLSEGRYLTGWLLAALAVVNAGLLPRQYRLLRYWQWLMDIERETDE